MLEIYNEKVRDLLSSGESKDGVDAADLQIMCDKRDGIEISKVVGAERVEVRCAVSVIMN